MAVEQIQRNPDTTAFQPVAEDSYRRVSLLDPDGHWELHDGMLREKPGMSIAHGGTTNKLAVVLQNQLGWDEYRVRNNCSRLRISTRRTYIPDIAVVPRALDLALWENPYALELYEAPLPLVVEVWSPTTGGYDIAAKLENYQLRGDDEIWYLHPYDRTLTAWVREEDRSYRSQVYRGGTVPSARLPVVAIDLAWLFEP